MKIRYVLISISLVLFFMLPNSVDTANFTNASATLTNSRLSFRAGVNDTPPKANNSFISIDTTGHPNTTTDHLYVKDSICFTDTSFGTCKGDQQYEVATVVDSTGFSLTTPLLTDLAATDYVIVKQATGLTITFTTQSEVPATGDILITLPAASERSNDGFPDTGETIRTSGFDLNNVGTGDITIQGCTDSNWSVTSVTAGSTDTDHVIRIDRNSSTCASNSTITVTIDSNPGLINPAPITTHTKGRADIYTLNVKTRDSSDATLDQIDIRVAPVESVLTLSASVSEGLSLTVSGITANEGMVCGITRSLSSPDTSATSIPWGIIGKPESFYDAAQRLNVTSNANTGYVVSVEQDDQMGRDGKTCLGPSAGETDQCIQDTVCSSTNCSETSSQDWTNAADYNGLGYSLENISGTDALFSYNDSSREFSARQLPDREAGELSTVIMYSTATVNNHQVYMCYRLSVPSTQPAGYYYNRVTYTATAGF